MADNVLWAVSAKCPYSCKYCYLSFDKDNNPMQTKINLFEEDPIKALEKILNLNPKRVFVAGAEPLILVEINEIIDKLNQKGIKTVLCTNGILLTSEFCKSMSGKIEAYSISLDSATSKYTDYYRNERSFDKIIESIKLAKSFSDAKVGVYTVITRKNISEIFSLYKLLTELNADYFIVQPIHLPKTHKLFKELCLLPKDIEDIKTEVLKIREYKSLTYFPGSEYMNLVYKAIEGKEADCFLNKSLNFVNAEGEIFGCPNASKIKSKGAKENGCNNFSCDCVNMYELIRFDEVLYGKE